MNNKQTSDLIITPAVQIWLAEQTAAGHSRASLFESLRASGWQAMQAAHIMSLTPYRLTVATSWCACCSTAPRRS
jgi:hypothetical protein